jgi:hypothetical protein
VTIGSNDFRSLDVLKNHYKYDSIVICKHTQAYNFFIVSYKFFLCKFSIRVFLVILESAILE